MEEAGSIRENGKTSWWSAARVDRQIGRSRLSHAEIHTSFHSATARAGGRRQAAGGVPSGLGPHLENHSACSCTWQVGVEDARARFHGRGGSGHVAAFLGYWGFHMGCLYLILQYSVANRRCERSNLPSTTWKLPSTQGLTRTVMNGRAHGCPGSLAPFPCIPANRIHRSEVIHYRAREDSRLRKCDPRVPASPHRAGSPGLFNNLF